MPSVTFVKPWGKRSWLVSHTSPLYENERPAHVEVCGSPVAPDQTYELVNLRVRGRALMFDVEKCENLGRPGEPAHFTIGFYADHAAACEAMRRYWHTVAGLN